MKNPDRDLGRQIAKDRLLVEARRTMGISYSQLGRFLGTGATQARKWAESNTAWIHDDTAIRIAAVYKGYEAANEWLRDNKMDWSWLVPLSVAAGSLGVARNVMRERLQQADVDPIDFGVLGEWVTQDEVNLCRR